MVNMSGICVEIFEDGHVKLMVPAMNHLYHLGIVYAGTHFMLMEVAGAALFFTLYGVEKFIPINKGMSIRFLKPAMTDISCELSMSSEEAQKKLMPILYAVLPRLDGLPTAFVYTALGVLGNVLRALTVGCLLAAVYAGRKQPPAPPRPPTF